MSKSVTSRSHGSTPHPYLPLHSLFSRHPLMPQKSKSSRAMSASTGNHHAVAPSTSAVLFFESLAQEVFSGLVAYLSVLLPGSLFL